MSRRKRLKRRRKRNRKFFKKLLIIILLFAAVLIGIFFVDRKTFDKLTNNVFIELNKITSKIQKQLSKYKKEKYDSIEINDNLAVFFLDVGQADSILVKYQDEYMLIDAGNNNDGEKLVNYFNYLGIKEFKHVFGTHAHEDHIGGMDNIIKKFKILNFYMPDDPTTTETFVEVLNALEKNNVKLQTPKVGTRLTLGRADIEILSIKNKQQDMNDDSIVLKLTYDNISFLFTGDATQNIEKEILNKDLESTVLKVGHHGSKYSNSAQFLRKVNPKYAVISCGINNDYYHPHNVVLEKLEKLNTKIYRTDLDGTIVALTDGNNIEFKTIKTYTDGG